MHRKDDLSAALLGVCVAIILWVAILSREPVIRNGLYTEPHSLDSLVRDLHRNGIIGNTAGNVLLFIPFGTLYPQMEKWGRQWQRTVLIGFCLSLFIETVQLITRRGFFDPVDLFLNTFGALIGYGVYKACLFFAFKVKKHARKE